MMDIERGLVSMVYNFFAKMSKESGFNIVVKPSEQLVEELHKPITRKF